MAKAKRRLRSGTVVLGGVGTLAAMLTACGSEPDKRCVDRDSYSYDRGYKVLDSKRCSTGSSSLKSRTDPSWYYDSKEKDGWARGGTFTKPRKGGGSGGSGSGGSDVDRGGFGSSGGSVGG